MTCCGRCRLCRPEWEDLERTIQVRTDERSQAINRAIRAEDQLRDALMCIRKIRDGHHDNQAGGSPGAFDRFCDGLADADRLLSLAAANRTQQFPEYLKGG